MGNSRYLLFVLLVLLPIFLLFLLLLLRDAVARLMVVRREGRAHGVHRAHGAVSHGGVGVAVAP